MSPSKGQVSHALLTRPPLSLSIFLTEVSNQPASFDLHVLSTPPAFILSQDQTLILKGLICSSLHLANPFLYFVKYGLFRPTRSEYLQNYLFWNFQVCSAIRFSNYLIIYLAKTVNLIYNMFSRDNIRYNITLKNPCQEKILKILKNL